MPLDVDKQTNKQKPLLRTLHYKLKVLGLIPSTKKEGREIEQEGGGGVRNEGKQRKVADAAM